MWSGGFGIKAMPVEPQEVRKQQNRLLASERELDYVDRVMV